MRFYQDCFGAELSMQTIGESPLSENMPENMKNYVLHATLRKGDVIIMATDMVSNEGLLKGNSVSLMINCSNEEEIRSYYSKLVEGGKATHPVTESFWGSLSGDLVDKFGNHWLLNFEQK